MSAPLINGAAAEYLGRGWAPLPVHARGKEPSVGDGWQNFVADENTRFSGNVGVLLGARSNGLIDIDLDCSEAIALAPDVLPPTDAIFGRKSKQRSHYLYICEPPPETKQHKEAGKTMLVELRSTGAQTVFPPSIHAEGEAIEWAANGEPARIDAAELSRRVGVLAGLSILRRHWPEANNRYNAEGALIGTLLRAGYSEYDVVRTITLIQKHAGPARDHDPEKSVARLAKKLAEKKPVPGLNKLREHLGATIVDQAIEWMALRRRGTTYEERGGALYWNTKNKSGDPVKVQLSNFTAEIAEVIKRDDGSGRVARQFIVKSDAYGRVEVPAEEFDAMTWVTAHWGPHARVAVGHNIRAHLAEAIKTFSDEAEERTIYAHLGWREIDGRMLYLHAGGAIGDEGPVEGYEVDPGGNLRNYVLPIVDNLKVAVHASLRMRDVGDAGFLMLAAVYRAPLVEFCPVTTSVYLEGKTGAFKSAIQGVALSHWGAHWDGVHFPANWTGTANALEKIAFILKDTLCVVDDFKPSDSPHEAEKLHQTADRFLRAAANLGGRDRMNADSTLRETYHPRGLVMSSGEDVPKGQSLRARLVVRHLEKGEIVPAKLTALQIAGAQGVLAQAMAGYVQFLARHDPKAMREKLAKRAVELRAELSGGGHARTPDNAASLLLGVEVLALFAQDSGAIDAIEAEEFLSDARRAITTEAKEQEASQAEEDPAERFVNLVGEALAGGRVHLADHDGQAPAGMEMACGWRERHYHSSNGEEHIAWQPQGDRIGWTDGDRVWLRTTLAYSAAEKLSREQNRSLGVTLRTLSARLVEEGLGEKSDTVRVEGGVQRAGLKLSAAALGLMTEVPSRTYAELVEDLRAAACAVRGQAVEDGAKLAADEVIRLCDEALRPDTESGECRFWCA